MEMPWSPQAPQPAPLRCVSGPGIASFTIAMLTVIMLIDFIAIMGAWISTPHGPPRENEPVRIALGVWGFSLLGLWLIGTIFGVWGLFQRNRKKPLAVFGVLLN